MNNVLCCFFVAAALFVVAESLDCFSCKTALMGRCLDLKNITCPANKPNCYVGNATFLGMNNFISINTQGCLDTLSCDRDQVAKILGASYNVTYNCCQTDMCNNAGANTVKLSLATGALLFSLWNSVRC